MEQEFKTNYGHLFEGALLNEILEVGIYKEIPAGTKIMDIGSYIKGMPLLISGAIKILREDKNGDELLLYYLEKGETCSMTMSCCMGQAKSEIRAIAETDVKMMSIPAIKMEEWASKYKSWRSFIFESYHNRLNEMFQTIDSIAFNNMDTRLLDYLKEKARVNNKQTIHHTHQEIAYELHTSRVVISRLLKKLENQGKIELNRSYIQIINLEE